MVVQILEGIDFVGYVDWNLRDFHGFETRRGVTYNSYLIADDKKAVIDAVKAPYSEVLIGNLKEKVPLDSIDYIIVNHAEPDHGGAIKDLLKVCKKAKIVCTLKGKEILSGYNDTSSWNFIIVKTGDRLSLGKKNLEFIETPMVHWPDSMFTYVIEDKILFSMDAFGQHFSSSNKFDDEVDLCAVMEEAKKYYANIIMPFGKQVLSILEKVSGYDIKMIVPAHGVIWKKYLKDILAAYRNWASFTSEAKVLIVYDTMWQSTKLMADALFSGVCKKNIEVKIMSIRTTGLTDIVTEILDSAVVAFGSSTLNMGMMPMMGALLTYLKGLSPKNKEAVVFGSFGWGKGAVEDVTESLGKIGFELLNKNIKAKWMPSEMTLKECFDLGVLLADRALEISQKQKLIKG